jgi:hypothetical protein
MSSQEQVLNLLGALATISVTGIGLAVGGIIGATVMAGIGLNLSSNIIHGGCSTLKEKWLNSENGLLNHDVQKALGRAFIKSLSSLEKKYLDPEQTRTLKRSEKESYKDLFRELRNKANETLPATIERIRLDPDIKQFLFAVPEADNNQMWDLFVGDSLVATYGSDFRRFLRDNLLNETLFWFGEELKTDSTDCNKAWRAFQRMLLEGIYAGVQSIQANQVLLSRDLSKLDTIKDQLKELREEIDRRLPDELFQRDIETALGTIKSTLQTISQTSRRIDHNVEIIREDLKSLLERENEVTGYQDSSPAVLEATLTDLRQRMLTAHSKHDLKTVLYETEEFLGKNPHYAGALLLKDQIEEALDHESARRAPVMAIHQQQRARRRMTPILASVFLLMIGSVIFIAFLGSYRMKNSSAPAAAPTVEPAMSSPTSSEGSLTENLIREKLREIADLSQLVERRKAHWKPKVRAAFDREMKDADMMIEDARKYRDTENSGTYDWEIAEEKLERAANNKLEILKYYYRQTP